MSGIAFVGTGFVADYYMMTLANHPGLKLLGVWDHAPTQLNRFAGYYGVRKYGSLDDVLADPAVEIVVNLTTIESHFAVSSAALGAGKHVYSEKPLAGSLDEVTKLVAIAKDNNRILAGAPANTLTETHAAVAKLLAEGAIGTPKLVYAEMEDGAAFRQNWREWRSVSGAVWPGEDEFIAGCTLEHTVYSLAWLVSLFGPVDTVTAFSLLTFPDKGVANTEPLGPDFSTAMLNFHSGVAARLTTGLCAPKDRAFTIMGDGGTITVPDVWDFSSPARIERTNEPRSLVQRLAGRIEHQFGLTIGDLPKPGRRIAVDRKRNPKLPAFPSRIDFSGGIATVATAINGGPQPPFSGDMALHLTEIALAISGAGRSSGPYRVKSKR